MKNKVIFAFLVFICFFYVSCATQGNRANRPESWNVINSPDDCVGKWEGSYTSSIPRNVETLMPQSSIEMTVFIEYERGAARVNSNMKMDFDKFVTDWANTPEMEQAGYAKDGIWDLLAGEFVNLGFIVGGKYFIYTDLSDDAGTFFSADAHGVILINDRGDKLKISFSEPISFGLGDAGISEIILYKR